MTAGSIQWEGGGWAGEINFRNALPITAVHVETEHMPALDANQEHNSRMKKLPASCLRFFTDWFSIQSNLANSGTKGFDFNFLG